jgi:hypothetical protein
LKTRIVQIIRWLWLGAHIFAIVILQNNRRGDQYHQERSKIWKMYIFFIGESDIDISNSLKVDIIAIFNNKNIKQI